MSVLPLLVTDQISRDTVVRREMDARRRLNFEFFDQLDCLDMSAAPDYIAEELEGAD